MHFLFLKSFTIFKVFLNLICDVTCSSKYFDLGLVFRINLTLNNSNEIPYGTLFLLSLHMSTEIFV